MRGRTRWILFVAVAAVCGLSVFQSRILTPSFDQQPVIHGEGIIYDKLVDETNGTAYLLQVGVSLDNGRVVLDYAATDADTWKRLAKGDRIGVLYQRSRGGGRIRIREVGLVALPPSKS